LSKSVSGHALTLGERALGTELMLELSNSNLPSMLQFASPDSLIRTMLLQLDQSLQQTVEMMILSPLDEDNPSRRRLREENAQQTTSFNRIVMHTIATYRETALSASDNDEVESQLDKFMDLAALLVSTAKRHLDHAEALSIELVEIISVSFVGSVLPVVLFALHSLLLEVKTKKLNFPRAALTGSTIFSEFNKCFESAYGTLRRSQSLSSVSPSFRGSSAGTEVVDDVVLRPVLTRSVSAELGAAVFPKFDASRSTGKITFDDSCTTCTADVFDMPDDDPIIPVIPMSVVICDVVYNIDTGAERNGNYFEVDILESDDCLILVGLLDPDDPANRSDNGPHNYGVPGNSNTSYAFLSWDGNKVTEGSPVGDSWTSLSVGDTLGCGFNMANRSIFFTRNGILLGTAFEDITTKSLSPVFALSTERSKQKIKINFGQTQPFKYTGLEVVLHPGARLTVCNIYFFYYK